MVWNGRWMHLFKPPVLTIRTFWLRFVKTYKFIANASKFPTILGSAKSILLIPHYERLSSVRLRSWWGRSTETDAMVILIQKKWRGWTSWIIGWWYRGLSRPVGPPGSGQAQHILSPTEFPTSKVRSDFIAHRFLFFDCNSSFFLLDNLWARLDFLCLNLPKSSRQSPSFSPLHQKLSKIFFSFIYLSSNLLKQESIIRDQALKNDLWIFQRLWFVSSISRLWFRVSVVLPFEFIWCITYLFLK